jgi:hypothetical protein
MSYSYRDYEHFVISSLNIVLVKVYKNCTSRRGANIPTMNRLLRAADYHLVHADIIVIDLGGNDLDDLDIDDEILCEMLFALLHNIREVNNTCVIVMLQLLHRTKLRLKHIDVYNHQVDRANAILKLCLQN